MLSNSITRLFAFLLALLASVSASLRAQIASQPTAQSACEAITNGSTVYGGQATFSVTASDPSNATYQWYMDGLALTNGANVSGATTASLTLSGLTRTDTGAQITVDVTDTSGTVSSTSVTLTVNYLTVTRPSTVAFDRCVGTSWSVQLPVPQTSSALSALTYQWYKLDSNGVTGTALTGKTSRTLNIAAVAMGDNGSYYCIVGNGTLCGTDGTSPGTSTAVSSAGRSFDTKVYITLSVSNLTPYVTSVAGDSNACNGTATSMSVYATLATSIDSSGNKTPATAGGRDALLTYQWQSSTDGSTNWTNVSNGGNISGATTRTLSFGSVAVSDGKYYRCAVTRTADTVAGTGCTSTSTTNSTSFQLAPYKAASIVTQPVSQSVCPLYSGSGGTAAFTVTPNGDANPAAQYQWQKLSGGSWTDVSGETNATLSFSNLAASDSRAGDYRVRVYNVCNSAGQVTSDTVTLTVKAQPSVTSLTSNRTSNTICTGDSIVLTAVGAGTGSLTYSWVKTAGNGSGATVLSTDATYTISSALSTDAGTYEVTVSGDCPPAASQTIVVTVNTPASVGASVNSPTVCEYVTGESSGSNTGNGTAVLSATISGTPAPTIRWELNGTTVTDGTVGGVTISGATTDTLTISGLSYGSIYAGTYRVYASTGCATEASSSTGGVVTVQRALELNNDGITGTDTQQWACAGSNITWSADAVGDGLTYQWESSADGSTNWATITGETSATLTAAAPTQATSVYYRCVVTGACRSSAGNLSETTATVQSTGKALAVVGNSGAIAGTTTICPNDPDSNSGNNVGNGATSLSIAFTQDGDHNPISEVKWYVRPAGSQDPLDWAEVSGAGYSISSLTSSSTSSVLTITNLAASKEYYAAGFTGCSNGTADFTSNTATVTVTAPVSFTAGASTLDTFGPYCEGELFTGYSISGSDLSGAGPFTYQWQKSADGTSGWTDLAGQNASTLTFASDIPAPSDNGFYRCVIRGTCRNPAYAYAVGELVVRTKPSVTTSPSAVSVCPGVTSPSGSNTGNGAASFTVTFTGDTTDINVRWQVSTDGGTNFTNLAVNAVGYSGVETQPTNGSATLSLSAITQGDARHGNYYRARISNGCQTTPNSAGTSAGAMLTVYAQPTVLSTSADVSACESQSSAAVFTVTATGQGLTYQWFQSADGTSGWSSISGATLSSLTINTPALSDAGYFRCTVSGTCQTDSEVYSAVRQLTVNAKPSFTAQGAVQPSGATVCPYVLNATNNSGNGTVTLSATAAGFGPISYQWQQSIGGTWTNISDSANVSGSGTNSLTLTGLVASDSRLGDYRVHVTSSCTVQADDINSSSATVALYEAPSVSTPSNQTVCEGDANVTFSVTSGGDIAVGGSALTYLWEKQNGASWSTVGGDASSLTIATAALSDEGTYRVTVSGRCAPPAVSGSFTLTVRAKPVITSMVDNSVCPSSSSTAVLSVVATGYDLHYAWAKVGGGSVGSDSATLTLSSVSSADAGSYTVTVTGGCTVSGDAPVTATAILTVHAPVSLTSVSLGGNSSAATGADLSATVAAGQELALAVVATGSPAPTYQWKKGGVDITGATSSSYTVANATTADAGTYACAVTNTCGTESTRNFVISIQDAGDKCYTVGSLPNTAASADLNGDGANDMVVSNEGSGTVSVMLNNRGLLENSQTLSLASGAQPRGLTVADFNADGALDLAVAVPNLGTVEVFLGTLSGGNPTGLLDTTSSTLNFGAGAPVDVASVRADATGKRDLIVCDLGSFLVPGNLYRVVMGSSGFGTPAVIATGGLFSSVAVGDLDGDGDDDIVAGNTSTSLYSGSSVYGIHVLECTSKGVFAAITGSPFNPGRVPNSVSIASQRDGSAMRSIVVSSLAINSRGISVLGSSSLSAGYTASSVAGTGTQAILSAVLGDVDGDSVQDLVYVAANGKGYVIHSFGAANSLEDLSLVSASAGSASRVMLAQINPSNTCGAQTDMVFVHSGNTGSVCVLQPRTITLLSSPSDVTQCATTSASLSVSTVGGGSSIAYQWKKSATLGGTYTDISGANSATLSFSSLATGDYGYYKCVISNNCGSSFNETSEAALVTVKVVPSVSSQPSGNTICRDGSHTFTVVATPSTGSTATTLSYQWQYSSTSGGTFSNIDGEVSASLSISTALVSQSGYYRCVVTNTCGTVDSNEAHLIVDVPAAITGQPSSGDFVCAGGSKTFTVTAEGTVGGVNQVTYQWFKTGDSTPLINVNPYSGVDTASLTIAPVATNLAGTYYCVVTNSCEDGSSAAAISDAATLDVRTYATISNPSSASFCEGTTAEFSVNVTGTNTTSVDWFRSDAPTVAIPVAVSGGVSTLTFTAARGDHGVTFSARVSNECSTLGVGTTASATLTVLHNVEVSQDGSTSTTVCEGASSVSFSVTASPSSGSNSSSITYRWLYNGSDISLSDSHYSGADSATLTISSLVRGDAGNYSCRVTNTCNTVTSGNFGLTVNYDPAITSQPTSSTTVCVNSVVTLSVVATGQPAPTYQWKKGGSNISGATLSSYTIPAAQSSDAGSYTVVVTNSCNNTESNPATVVVNNVSTNLDTSCFSTAAGAVMSVGLGSNVAVAVTGGVQLLSNNGSGVLSAGSVISLDGTPSAMFAMSSSQLAVAVGDKVKFLSGSGLSTVTTAIDMGNSSLQITSLAVMGNDVFVGYQYGLNVYRADSSSPSGYSVQQMTDVPPVAAMAVGDLVSSNAGDELVVLAGLGSNRSLLVFASSASSISDALVSQDSLGSSSALALADLDRNGSFDAVAVAGSGGVQMHLGSSLALASSTVTNSAALSIVAGQFDNNSTGDLAYVLSTGATVVASDINSSTGAAGSTATDCYGTGVNVAKVATASVGQSTGNCNTDELAVTRTATAQVCTIRFKCGQSVSSIADSGCSSGYTSYPTAGSSNSPVLGSNTFAITLSGAANYVYAATLMQLSTAGSVPVTITLDGPCKHVFSAANGYTDVVQISTITNGTGAATNRMPIPNTASLISTELRAQWLLIDGGPMFGNTMGLSNGLLIRIGEY